MPSQLSYRDWPWSSSGYTDIHTCMVATCQVRKIITGKIRGSLGVSPQPYGGKHQGPPALFREGGVHAGMTDYMRGCWGPHFPVGQHALTPFFLSLSSPVD